MQKMSFVRNQGFESDSGIGTGTWVSIGIAILLFFSMSGLETLIYRITGCGFLLP
jgi:hypothetical protein